MKIDKSIHPDVHKTINSIVNQTKDVMSILKGTGLFMTGTANYKDVEELKTIFNARDLLYQSALRTVNNDNTIEYFGDDELMREEFFLKIWESLKIWFMKLGKKIASGFKWVFDKLIYLANLVIGVLTDVLDFVLELLRILLKKIFGDSLTRIVDFIKNTISVFGAMINAVCSFLSTLIRVLTNISDFIKNMITTTDGYFNVQYVIKVSTAVMKVIAYAFVIAYAILVVYYYRDNPLLDSEHEAAVNISSVNLRREHKSNIERIINKILKTYNFVDNVIAPDATVIFVDNLTIRDKFNYVVLNELTTYFKVNYVFKPIIYTDPLYEKTVMDMVHTYVSSL